MITGKSVKFEWDQKYLIPTAERKARRQAFWRHEHSGRAFKGIRTVPIGRPEDIDLAYEVPYRIRRVLEPGELYVPGKVNTRRSKTRRFVMWVSLPLAVWATLAAMV